MTKTNERYTVWVSHSGVWYVLDECKTEIASSCSSREEAAPLADAWNVLHFAQEARTACGMWIENGSRTQTTQDWAEVTCGSCKLEQPMTKVGAPEYRLPSHQRRLLTSLADQAAALNRAATRLSASLQAQEPQGQGAAPVNAVVLHSDTSEELSGAARTALLAVPSDAEGAYVRAKSVHDELRNAGLIGPRGGLTRKGSILKARLDSEQLDAMFGPE